jgi:hypothetical protein
MILFFMTLSPADTVCKANRLPVVVPVALFPNVLPQAQVDMVVASRAPGDGWESSTEPGKSRYRLESMPHSGHHAQLS